MLDAVCAEPRPSPDRRLVVRALGEVDLIGGWVEVALECGPSAPPVDDYQVLVTSYAGVPLFVQNRTRSSFEIHAVPQPRPRPRRATRCAYCVLSWTHPE